MLRRFRPGRGPFRKRLTGRLPETTQRFVTGVSKDGPTQAPIGGVTVKCFTVLDDVLRYTTVSDANGNYSIPVPCDGSAYYLVEYLIGAPDRAGTSVNTIRGV